MFTKHRRPQRVLMTADAVGGVWNYALDVLRGLSAYGIEVLLAVMGPSPSTEQRAEAQGVPNLQLAAGAYRLEWEEDVTDRELKEAGDWLRSLAGDFEPDVIHLNGYAHAAGKWNAPVLVVAHSCVYSWWDAVHGTPPPPSWEPYRGRVMQGLAEASDVVAPSPYMLASLRRVYGMPSLQGEVIHNWTDIHEVARPVKRPVVLSCGRLWDEAKNFRTLDEAASEVKWPIVAAGNSAHAQSNLFQFQNLKLAGVMPRREMLDLLAEASVFAHAAKYEPFGLAVLEAARSRCALVLSDIPSLRDLWGDSALFVRPDDSGAWTQALNSLIDDRSLRERFGDRAFRQSLHYSGRESVPRYMRKYEELMGTKREPATNLRDEATDQTLLPLHRF